MSLRVLLIEEDGGWSAQCLEYDIAAQAKTLAGLRHEFEKTFMSYVIIDTHSKGETFKQLGQAPREYFDLFERSDMKLEVTVLTVLEADVDADLPLPPLPQVQFAVAPAPALAA